MCQNGWDDDDADDDDDDDDADDDDDDDDDDGRREEEEEEERRRWDAGRCLFKTRTQHHRMVGKKVMHPKSGDAWEFRAWTATIARPTSLPLSRRDDDDDLGGFRCN